MSKFTVDRRYESEHEIKRSRFLAILFPCPDLQTFQAMLGQLADEHPQATHLTYAWRIETPEGLRERCFDAGEPSGTAGRPILAHLQGRNLINACLVVIRYFGGIKLGAGGLVRAYSQAARRVLESACLRPHIAYRKLVAEVDYARYQHLPRYLEPCGAIIEATEYGTTVKVTLRVPESQLETVKQILQSH